MYGRLSLFAGFLLAGWLVAAAIAADVAESPTARPSCLLAGPAGERPELAKVRLAGATRDALRVGPSQPVVVTCPGGAGVLIASGGAAGVPATASVRFAVDVEQDGAWVPLVEQAGGDGAEGWVDLRAEVASEQAGSRRFRLRTATSAVRGDLRLYWGAVRFLPAAALEQRPPNLILVSLDTLGARYLGSHGGHRAAGRNIDAFLDKSFAFRRAYATYPNTLVSHTSLFSGLYPTSHGVYGGIRDSQVEFDLLSTVLRGDGYLNVAFTENAFVSSDFGFDRDFDWYDDGPDRGASSFLGDARETFGRAQAWLDRYGNDAPFLLFVHTYEVHSPYIVRDDQSRSVADEVFAGAEIESTPDSSADMEHLHNSGYDRLSPDQVRRLEALHVGELRYLDRHFAELIAAIDAAPFANRTLVVVFSDHGDEFDPVGKIGHGETLADEVLHVPLAFYLPGRIQPGEFDQPVSLVDVVPTVLDFLGKPGALPADGRSLMPLIEGRATALPPRAVFAELQRAAGTCQELRLPHDCFVGRFVAFVGDRRFETSMIPHYRQLTEAGGHQVEDAAETLAFDALLSAYVTGSPWQTQVPWRPQSVAAERGQRPAIDDVTRQRLEALGYDF